MQGAGNWAGDPSNCIHMFKQQSGLGVTFAAKPLLNRQLVDLNLRGEKVSNSRQGRLWLKTRISFFLRFPVMQNVHCKKENSEPHHIDWTHPGLTPVSTGFTSQCSPSLALAKPNFTIKISTKTIIKKKMEDKKKEQCSGTATSLMWRSSKRLSRKCL